VPDNQRYEPISELLVRWRAGDKEALASLVPLVYKELRKIARLHLKRERSDHTLQSAALVHEAYLRLMGQRPFQVGNRAHFLAVASRLMRQVLVDYARSHGAVKRGVANRVELDVSLVLDKERCADVLALDEALERLAKLDEQQSRLVEMRFFGGLELQEIAAELSVSESTVKRDWNVAKAWLARELKGERHGGKSRAMAED
jgi:RNA polymerase sigma factor (TIGR02999 family)